MVKKYMFPERVRHLSCLRRQKRAQAEAQLNWIFILIVGAVIMAFFAFIVIKQRGASEAKFAGKVSQQLNTILVGAKVSSGTVQEIPTPDLEIRFTCNDYYIGPASQRLGNRLVFAPEFLKGDTLLTWTLDWNVPFKITSFLYMTTPYVRYVFIAREDDRDAQAIFDALPEKLNKQLYTMDEYIGGSVRYDNDFHTRFIFINVGEPSGIPADFDDTDVSGLAIDTASSGGGLPYAQFLVRSSSGFIASGIQNQYIEPEVLYGAIFADKASDYKCIMERAYQRMNVVAKVYAAKMNLISPVYDSTNCEGFYKDNADIGDLIDATDVYPPNYALIGTSKTSLKDTNTRLQLRSCSLIY